MKYYHQSGISGYAHGAICPSHLHRERGQAHLAILGYAHPTGTEGSAGIKHTGQEKPARFFYLDVVVVQSAVGEALGPSLQGNAY